jgi:CubicO group peptidase (beta-lactamase class C family)
MDAAHSKVNASARRGRLPTIRRWGIVITEPGRLFDYSNLGYFLIGVVIARAAGKPLHEVLRDDVFRPLGMMNSTYGPGTDYASVRGYASAHDVALFGAFHMKAHRRDQRAILSDAAIDTMQTSTVPADGGQRYGLGWWIEENRFGYRSLLAQGGNATAQAWLRMIPSERVAVAVLANKGVGFPGDVVARGGRVAAGRHQHRAHVDRRHSRRRRRRPHRARDRGERGSAGAHRCARRHRPRASRLGR